MSDGAVLLDIGVLCGMSSITRRRRRSWTAVSASGTGSAPAREQPQAASEDAMLVRVCPRYVRVPACEVLVRVGPPSAEPQAEPTAAGPGARRPAPPQQPT